MHEQRTIRVSSILRKIYSSLKHGGETTDESSAKFALLGTRFFTIVPKILANLHI